MRFKNLVVKGAVPFPDRTELNFPASQVVALTGDNGAGKSTLLDCIYAAFFGDVTKPNGLYSLFKGSNDGMIDLTFEMKGTEYRIKRLIDGNNRKQKPWFYMNGTPVTEGKVAEFNTILAQTLGISEQAFLASIYNCQTQKGNPLSLKDGERRDLLSEVLGLGQFEGPFESVTEEFKRQEAEILGKEAQIAGWKNGAKDPDALASEKNSLEGQILTLEFQIQTKEEELQKTRQELANAQANAQQTDELRRQIGILENSIREDRAEVVTQEAKIKKNQDELLGKADDIRAAVERTEALNKDIAQAKLSLEEKRTALETWHADHREKLTQLSQTAQQEWELRQVAEKDLANLQMEKSKLQGSRTANEGKINSLRPSTEIIDRVPCKEMEISQTCELLKNAHENVQKIKALAQENEALGTQLFEIEQKLTGKQTEVDTLRSRHHQADDALKQHQTLQPPAELTEGITMCEGAIKKAEAMIQSLVPLVQNEPYLKDAEARIAEYQRVINQLNGKIQANETALQDYQRRLAEASDLINTINKYNQDIVALEHERKTLTVQRDSLVAQKGQVEAQIQQALEINKKVEEAEAALTDGRSRLALLALLKEGLGPKGARALKIDSAGPEISELVNALLRECYGQRFTIVIKTLRSLTSKDEFRECLEFSIIDNETGDETPVENKSGGEQQLIKEVISLGLCIYMRNRVGLDARTIIRDESCSALSEENTERYIRMLKKASEIGRFDQVVFVSHKSVAQNMADALIHVASGQVKVMEG